MTVAPGLCAAGAQGRQGWAPPRTAPSVWRRSPPLLPLAASSTNPWVVKNTGPSPGNLPTNADGTLNPYYVPNPRFNSVGPVQGGQEYVLTNGLDFGIEVRY